MKIITCEQGSVEWFAARTGVITASMFSTAVDKYVKVAVERISGETTDDTYQTWAMKRGNELEGAGRLLYADRTGNAVTETGVVLTDCGYFGYSSDGLVNQDGGIEIKCLLSAKSIMPVIDGDLSEFNDQMQGGMMINEREWCDFVLYVPQLTKMNKEIYIRRVYRNEAYIKTLRQDLADFNDHVWSLINKLSA
jgi:hypothetical protein